MDSAWRFVPLALPRRNEASELAWMPDSSSLLIAHDYEFSPLSPGPMRVAPSVLSIFDLDGTKVRTIEPDVEFMTFLEGMSVAPDGSSAVVVGSGPSPFSSPGDLLRVDLTQGRTENVTDSPKTWETSPSYAGNDTIAYVASVMRRTPEGERVSVSRVTILRDGQAIALTDGSQGPKQLSAAPGYSSVVFSASPLEAFDSAGLFLVPLHGGAPSQIAAGDLYQPSITSDGREVIAMRLLGFSGMQDLMSFNLPR